MLLKPVPAYKKIFIFCQNSSHDSGCKKKSKRMMKMRDKEFAMNLEEGLVDLSSKTPKNVRNSGETDRSRSFKRKDEFVVQPQESYEDAVENFDEALSDDLKVILLSFFMRFHAFSCVFRRLVSEVIGNFRFRSIVTILSY